MIPKASEDLLGYNSWLKSLTALPVGTILQWTTGYVGSTLSTSLKAGQFTKITRIRKSNGVSDLREYDQVYAMAACNKNGKEFKKNLGWRVEAIARKLHDGDVVIVNNG